MTNLAVPDPKKLFAVQQLCELQAPYTIDAEADALFVRAMAESIRWHSEHSEFYRNLLNVSGFKVDQLKSIDDVPKIPFVLANFFKTHEVLSIDRKDVIANFTSSGTTGQKSQIFFDQWSMMSGYRMVDWIFDYHGWVTPEQKTNYLLSSYEIESDSKLGTAHTDNFLCKYAPVQSVFHLLRRDGAGGHEFDAFGCVETLKRYEKEGLPVRIFGYPAFLYFVLKRMRDLKVPPLKLSKDSLIFFGGGWKGNADKAISKKELYTQITEQLGIPDARIRDGFGSVEHPIPYVECEHHQFHAPVWSRVYIRDLKTLEVLPYGEKGFLHFVSPYITSMPSQSVLMGDLASLQPGSSCPCQIDTPYFIVHGRAGTSKNRSCAVAAAELLKK
jgi:phenylacetate-coenzyme A ligase PaaK-like adenylate-forming protein